MVELLRQNGRLSCRTKTYFRCERKKVETDDDEQGGSINSIVKHGNSLWVNSGLNSKSISLVNENGKTIKSLPLRFKIEDITCSKNGELVISSFRDKVIRKVSNTGVTSDLFNVPYHPKGITTTKDGGYPVCEDSQRLVVKYTSEGDEECIYEYNGEEKLFTRPFRVTENINGDICVIDKTAMGSGQVIILDRTGLVKTIYSADRHQTNNGHTNKIVSRFAPSDIACDKNGRVFIVESDNHKEHILNKTGSCIGHF
ncbi:TRIM56 [Mytilus edulis]|uniref:TRIM56 n=1 Tax=Mytilus edulis TaxID=6550 RepID=A0A8S3TIG2_MYTED|nr:TRIM56 [Mytilus edulis]